VPGAGILSDRLEQGGGVIDSRHHVDLYFAAARERNLVIAHIIEPICTPISFRATVQ